MFPLLGGTKAMIKVNSQGVFMMLGGSMIKVNSPLLREILKEAFEEGRRFSRQEAQREASEAALVTVLVTRFGATAEAVKAALKRVRDDRLKDLLVLAGTCPDLDAFHQALARAEASGNPEKRRDSRIVAGIGVQPQGNLPSTGTLESRQMAFQCSSMGSTRQVTSSSRASFIKTFVASRRSKLAGGSRFDHRHGGSRIDTRLGPHPRQRGIGQGCEGGLSQPA